MSTVKGSAILLKKGSNVVGATRTLSLNITADIIRTTTKENDWHTKRYGRRKWNGSLGGVVDVSDVDGQVALFSDIMSGNDDITIVIGKATPASGDPVYTGSVGLEKHGEGYNENNESTYDVSFRGNGPLTQTIT